MLGANAPELAETTCRSKRQAEHKQRAVEGSRGGATWALEEKEPDSLSEEQLAPPAGTWPARSTQEKGPASRPRNEEAATTDSAEAALPLLHLVRGAHGGSLHTGVRTLTA